MSKKAWIVAILAVVIVTAAAVLLLSSRNERKTTPHEILGLASADEEYFYNGYAFARSGGMWFTQIQAENKLYNVVLHYSPKELEQITLQGGYSQDFFKQGRIYITFDPEGSDLGYVALAVSELGLNMARVWSITPVAACTANVTVPCATRPIVRCEDTTSPAIYITQSEKPQILASNSCVQISGNNTGIVKATEAFLYRMYGVI